jgi:hypothetical protein
MINIKFVLFQCFIINQELIEQAKASGELKASMKTENFVLKTVSMVEGGTLKAGVQNNNEQMKQINK